MKVAVLMTCFNRADTTLSCLGHLRAAAEHYHKADIDLWLNDDGSTDGTSEAVQKWQNENAPLFTFTFHLHLIHGSGHDYWSGGMRRAWDAACKSGIRYDGYLWLNDDTLINSSAFEVLLKPIGDDNKDNVGIVVGVTSDLSGRAMTYGGRDRNMNRVLLDGTYHAVQTFDGNCVFISHATYEKIGGMADYVTHAIGDNDYGLRATEAGIRIVQTPRFVGTCGMSSYRPDWTKSSVPLAKRLRNLYSPRGYSQAPVFFHFNRIHFGLPRAITLWCKQHLRVFAPWIWERFK